MHICHCSSLLLWLVFSEDSVYRRLKLWEPDRPGFSEFTLLSFIRIRDKYMYSAWHKINKILFIAVVIVTSCIISNNRYIGKLERGCREKMRGEVRCTSELGPPGYLQMLLFGKYLSSTFNKQHCSRQQGPCRESKSWP